MSESNDTNLRTRIAKVLYSSFATELQGDYALGWSLEDDYVKADYLAAADAVIRELGPIPDRRHVDDQGRVWEWCGGQPGTWARMGMVRRSTWNMGVAHHRERDRR